MHHLRTRAVLVALCTAACGGSQTLDDAGAGGQASRGGGAAGGALGGGRVAGGAVAGGAVAGGAAAGGEAGGTVGGGLAGGESAGGEAGGTFAGGPAGGESAGGSVAGGSVAGGSVAGGSVAGGSVAGGSVAGGSVAGGTAGGARAGGQAGGVSTSGGQADGGSLDTCSQIARRECSFYERCKTSGTVFGTLTFRPNDLASVSQRSQCEALRRESCEQFQASLNRGRRALDPVALQRCLDARFPSTDCLKDSNLALTACREETLSTPRTAVGALCTTSAECAGGHCAPSGLSDCGQCRPYVNADGGTGFCAGTSPTQCSPGTGCRTPPSGGVERCLPLSGVDAGCTNSAQCASGLICPVSTTNRVCTVARLEGEPCTKGRFECQRSFSDFNLLCATHPGTSDGGADRCTRRYNTAPLGFCNSAETGLQGAPQGPECLDAEYCDNGLCQPRRAVGQPCTGTSDVCRAGTRCVSGLCAPYLDVGEPCANSGQCRAFLFCSGASSTSMGTCQPALSFAGSACTPGTGGQPACTNESYCPAGGSVCATTKAANQACTQQSSCSSGNCGGGLCVAACWQ